MTEKVLPMLNEVDQMRDRTCWPIAGHVQQYAWGRPGALSDLLGIPDTGGVQAEVWFGTHPNGPTRVIGGNTLAEVSGELPFLLKVLAIGRPLSLQVHPDRAQARRRFAAQLAGEAPRIYADDGDKPEMIYALQPLQALAGFRPASDSLAQLDALLSEAAPNRFAQAFRAALSSTDPIPQALATAMAEHEERMSFTRVLASWLWRHGSPTLAEVAGSYPDDPGLIIAFLMNEVTVPPAHCLFIPPRQIHAYVSGCGIELMRCSDNVLRAGLTAKRVDAAEFLQVVDARSTPPVELPPCQLSEFGSVHRFTAPVGGFALSDVQLAAGRTARIAATGPSILLCLAGSGTLQLVDGDARCGAWAHRGEKESQNVAELGAGGAFYLAAGHSWIGVSASRDLHLVAASTAFPAASDSADINVGGGSRW